LRLKSTLGVK